MTQAEIFRIIARKAVASNGLLNLPIPSGRFAGYHSGFSDGTQQIVTYQWNFIPKFTVIGAQFYFGNWTLGNSAGGAAGEALGQNDITITAGLFSGNQILFNGQPSITIKPGGTVKSDPLPKKLVAGTSSYIKVCVSVATLGQKWPLGLTTNQTNEGSSTGADNTLNGTNTNNLVALGYHPFAVIGKPITNITYPNVGVVGDSIAMGSSGDTIDSGWIKRGLDAQSIPFARLGCGGAAMTTFINGSYTNLLNGISGGDIVITNFGANDMSFADLPTGKAAYLAWWTALANMGSKVIQSTILPRDSFTTAAKQLKNDLNDWFRDGAPMTGGVAVATGTVGALRMNQTGHPLYKVIEVADLAETARNSNVWKTGYSPDGVHPNATGATALAAAIVASDYIL